MPGPLPGCTEQPIPEEELPMKQKIVPYVLSAIALIALVVGTRMMGQSELKIVYGTTGIQQLSYANVVLEDTLKYPADIFHIWHMKATDLKGNVLSGGQYTWGELNNGRTWDANAHKWTYKFIWGTITVQYAQAGDTLNVAVTEVNNSNSGIILDGATIYPLALHFPTLPAGFVNASYSQLAFNTTGPSVTLADYGTGEVAAVDPDAKKPLYSGFQPAGPVNSYTPLISSTAPDNLAAFFPHFDRPVSPGQTDTFVVSLRFGKSGTKPSLLAQDVFNNWSAAWPAKLHWNDRRILGTGYLASSPSGDPNDPGGYPNNPRRYFNDSNPADFDVRTPAGLALFQARVLEQASNNVQNLKRLSAQGIITWDIEGEQYPQNTSYVCEPDEIATVAPEMESVVSDSSSPYHGLKLDDAYFKIIRDAGFRVGVCVRPQHFTLNSNGTAGQVFLADALIPAELIRKIKFAHDRWKATIFYVDSTVDPNGGTLDASIFQQVAAAFPDSLLIPEETTPKYYAYTGAFNSFIFHTDLGTNPVVYDYYPHAFSANLINDVDPAKLALYEPQLTQSVRNGDILMVHADYWQANDPTVVQIYQNAQSAPAAALTPAPPAPAIIGQLSISNIADNQTISGTVSILGQVLTRLGSSGSYLIVDGHEVHSSRVSAPPYTYLLDTRLLPNGQHILQLSAEDTTNQLLTSRAVVVEVANPSTATDHGPLQ
jgi:hypothetical protein